MTHGSAPGLRRDHRGNGRDDPHALPLAIMPPLRERLQASPCFELFEYYLAIWLPCRPFSCIVTAPVLLSYGSSPSKMCAEIGVQMQRGHCCTEAWACLFFFLSLSPPPFSLVRLASRCFAAQVRAWMSGIIGFPPEDLLGG